jgi:hypothetical protein
LDCAGEQLEVWEGRIICGAFAREMRVEERAIRAVACVIALRSMDRITCVHSAYTCKLLLRRVLRFRSSSRRERDARALVRRIEYAQVVCIYRLGDTAMRCNALQMPMAIGIDPQPKVSTRESLRWRGRAAYTCRIRRPLIETCACGCKFVCL